MPPPLLIRLNRFHGRADSHQPSSRISTTADRVARIKPSREQGYKQVKDELGWAGFQVRSDLAIRRHQVLVNCAFSFCWAAWSAHPAPHDATPPASRASGGERGPRTRRAACAAVLAPGDPGRARLAGPVDHAAALVGRLVERVPAPQLQALINSVAAGCGLHLYIPT
jgi:hypothetical protein